MYSFISCFPEFIYIYTNICVIYLCNYILYQYINEPQGKRMKGGKNILPHWHLTLWGKQVTQIIMNKSKKYFWHVGRFLKGNLHFFIEDLLKRTTPVLCLTFTIVPQYKPCFEEIHKYVSAQQNLVFYWCTDTENKQKEPDIIVGCTPSQFSEDLKVHFCAVYHSGQ